MLAETEKLLDTELAILEKGGENLDFKKFGNILEKMMEIADVLETIQTSAVESTLMVSYLNLD